jgi:flagella basal body P-ring formation protein FlgA
VGQIISFSDIKKEQLVKRNQPVKAIIKSSDWSVSVSGVAKGSGYLGDSINFYNPETKKSISARIVGDGVVEIQR